MTQAINFWSVKPLRAAGLEARWGRCSNGSPCIFVRNPNAKADHQKTQWWVLDKSMAESMKKHGIIDGFDYATLLGDLFYIPA